MHLCILGWVQTSQIFTFMLLFTYKYRIIYLRVSLKSLMKLEYFLFFLKQALKETKLLFTLLSYSLPYSSLSFSLSYTLSSFYHYLFSSSSLCIFFLLYSVIVFILCSWSSLPKPAPMCFQAIRGQFTVVRLETSARQIRNLSTKTYWGFWLLIVLQFV